VTTLADLTTTKTADAIWEASPLSGKVNRWGGEIYFAILLSEAKNLMELGEGHEIKKS